MDIESKTQNAIVDFLEGKLPALLREQVSIINADGELLVSIPIGAVLSTDFKFLVPTLRRWASELSDAVSANVRLHISEAAEVDGVSRSLLLALNKELPQHFREAEVSSLLGDSILVRLVPREGVVVTDATRESARKVSSGLIAEVIRFTDLEIEVIGQDRPAATAAMILRAIKISQPARISDISELIASEGYTTGTGHNLKRHLDRLIRNRLIQYIAIDGHLPYYVLTAAGIAALPSRIGRQSTDIMRALVLARRHR